MQTKTDVINNQLASVIKDYKRDFDTQKSLADKRRNIIDVIAEKVCDKKYAEEQLGGKNAVLSLSDEDIRDFIIKNVLDQKLRYIQIIKELQTLTINDQKIKQDLTEEVARLKEENAFLKQNKDDLKEFVPSDTKNSVIVKDFDGKMTAVNLNTVLTKLNQLHLILLEELGIHGKSEIKEIVAEFSESKDKSEASRQGIVKQLLTELVDFNLVEMDTISTGYRSKVIVYNISETGKALYEKQFNKKPVKSEKEMLGGQNKSYEHGYLIKDTAQVLKDMGYAVKYDAKECRFPVPGAANLTYVPDVVAEISETFGSKSGTVANKMFIEVELGHHNQHDFNDKLDKARFITKEIFFIVPNEDVVTKINEQLQAYSKSKLKEKINLTAYVQTLSKYAKNKNWGDKKPL